MSIVKRKLKEIEKLEADDLKVIGDKISRSFLSDEDKAVLYSAIDERQRELSNNLGIYAECGEFKAEEF